MIREFDVILWGASGFTGRLVAEHIHRAYDLDGRLKWAIAGRDRIKLEQLREEIGASTRLQIVVADACNSGSLTAMAQRTRVIISTVGPYQLFGSELVRVCVDEGTDYVDISGEPNWICNMLDLDDAAKATGARIVFSCGFDSVPFDLGVYFFQRLAKREFGVTLPRVRGRVRRLDRGIRGGRSGGSLATGAAMITAVQKNPSLRKIFLDPFALTPGFKGPEQPDGGTAYEDRMTGSWVARFQGATLNVKIVHRSNLLLKHAWGKNFCYDEMMMIDGPTANPSQDSPGQNISLAPGQGPSKADRAGGGYELLFIGELPDGRTHRIHVKGDMDPGAGSTSRILGESAVCLAQDVKRDKVGGGMWTSASAMGDELIVRLTKNAGLTFSAIR